MSAYTRKSSGLLVPAEHCIRSAEACELKGFGSMLMAGSGGEYIPTANLVAHLDAGNALSYPGTGQTWANLATSPADGSAQSAYNFWLGDTSAVEATDPNFAGAAGGMSAGEYFASDGDYFTLASGNTSFVNSMHKSGAAFTIIMWLSLGSTTGLQPLICDNGAGASSSTGVAFFATNGNLDLQVTNGTSEVLRVSKTTGLTSGAMNMVAVMLAAGASGYFWANGATVDTAWSASYSSPSTSSAAHTLLVGKFPEAGGLSPVAHIAKALVYNVGMLPDQLTPIWESTRGRFGI